MGRSVVWIFFLLICTVTNSLGWLCLSVCDCLSVRASRFATRHGRTERYRRDAFAAIFPIKIIVFYTVLPGNSEMFY